MRRSIITRISLPILPMIFMAAFLIPQPAHAAFGWLQLYQDGQRLLSETADNNTFTLSDFVSIADVDVSQWLHFGEVWGYIDDTGRLRASASTGDHSGNTQLAGRASSNWKGSYTKLTVNERPSFTIHPTDLMLKSVFAAGGGAGAGAPPNSYARWQIDVTVCGTGSNAGALCRTVFNQQTTLAGGQAGFSKQYTLTRTERVSKVNPDNGSVESDSVPGGPVEGIFDWGLAGEPVMYSTGAYQGSIPLPNVVTGEEYTVAIDVVAEVFLVGQGFEGQGVAEAIVANLNDVLGVDSGFALAPQGTPVPSPRRLCAFDYDSARYADRLDGSVGDLYTGLDWHRCALGYTLDDSATADLNDDVCQLAGPADFDWQSALQGAAADTLGGQSWRLPNVKELASLVNECQSPTIEPLPFPDTPRGEFWSSTPATQPQSIGVDFQTGDVASDDRSNLKFVRLVRNSGQPLVTPLPRLSLGKAGVVEGDSGLTQLVFPVLLSQPLPDPVTVDYSVIGISAEAGSDFTPASGTLTFPVDEVLGNVALTVTGDTNVEGESFNGVFSESVQLTLSNPSSNVALATSTGLGLIFDDEPLVSVRPAVGAQVSEADTDQVLEIVLSRPADALVTVDYTTVSGSATAGADFAALAGQAMFTPGQTAQQVLVSISPDMDYENEEDFFFDISNLSGNARLANTRVRSIIVDDEVPPTQSAVNDSGVNYCVSDISTQAEDCPLVAFPGQDGESGRDLTDDDPLDGPAGYSFSKLDAAGDPLVDQTGNDFPCVRDNVTGLVWEIKRQDAPRSLHYTYWQFAWYRSDGVNDGGVPGTRPALGGDFCWDTTNCGDPTSPVISAYCQQFEPMQCDTETFIERVNEESLCGFTDWRLPTAEEGFGLVNMDATQANALPYEYFPSGFIGSYWSSNTNALNPDEAWVWVKNSGSVSSGTQPVEKSAHRITRLVRGGTQP